MSSVTSTTVDAIFFDIDTQIDFLYPDGALYVPGAETIVENIVALNRFAAARGIPVVSTMDAHTPGDPEFGDWPPHCVIGTPGQEKPAATLLERRMVIPNRRVDLAFLAGPEFPEQIVLEKQALDCFTNPNLPALLERFHAKRFLVYGVVTEICVRHAAMGLLRTGGQVAVVMDAVRSLDDAQRDRFFEDLLAAGGTLTTLADVIGSDRSGYLAPGGK